jgi:hypothetical protein
MLLALVSLSRASIAFPWTLLALADNFDPSSSDVILLACQTMVFTDALNPDYTRTIVFLPGLSPVPKDDAEFAVPESVRRLAARRQAVVVVPGHRCVGGGPPATPALCTAEQALADVARLLLLLSLAPAPPREVLVVGEGYGGALAAFFRAAYPQYAAYAWAVSAPVRFAAFSPDADARLLAALANHSERCPLVTRLALAELAATPVRAYEAAEALVRAFEAGALGEYCRAMDAQNLTAFRAFVDAMAGASVFNTTEGERALRCGALGHFNVHNPKHWLRPPSVNESLFVPLCASVGVDLAAAEEAMNRRFGGLEIAVSATLFTYTRWDVHASSMEVKPDIARDRDVRADIDVAVYDRAAVDEDAVRRIMKWLDRKCDPRRGVKVHGQCKCKNGWAGDECQEQMITKGKLSGLSALAVALPTLIVIMTSVVAWKTVLADSESERLNPLIL